MKSAATLSAAAALLGGVDAFWRMGCHSRSGLARLDPLVWNGKIAPHSHAIHGGSGFSKDAGYDNLRASECSSCRVTEDKSAYWSPALNFIHENGTVELVPQVGGMLAYYLLFGENIKAFPRDFKMIAGDSRMRNFTGPVPDPEKSHWGKDDTTQHALMQKALGFNCLNYAIDPEPSMYRHFLPDKQFLDDNCANGIRAEIFFPSCWNGVDTESEDMRSHVQYPNLINAGECPEGFKERVPSLFFETIWDTSVFKGTPGAFVFSNGDPTGYGYHGDFLNGWDIDYLQSAVDQCTNPSGSLEDCPVFTPNLQSEEEGAQCHFEIPEELQKDNCGDQPGATELCGKVPIQVGPEYAQLLEAPEEIGDGEPAPEYPTTPEEPAPEEPAPEEPAPEEPAPEVPAPEVPAPPPAPVESALPEITNAPLVPILSHGGPGLVVTDENGGGMSNVAGEASLGLIGLGPDGQPIVGAQAATPVVAAAEAAAVTPAPAPPAAGIPPAGAGPPKVLGTSTRTAADGSVHVVVYEEVVHVVHVQGKRDGHAHKHGHHARRAARQGRF